MKTTVPICGSTPIPSRRGHEMAGASELRELPGIVLPTSRGSLMSTSDELVPDDRPSAASAFQLSLLFLFALVPRMAGLLWGSISGDENLSDSAKVLAGQLVPGHHFYPPLLNYLNAAAYAALFAIGRLTGVWGSIAAFREQW